MIPTTAKTAQPDRPAPGKIGGDGRARAAELQAANINPRTGLATDYLNHFNEAIMLLEMVPDMPECAEDFLGWQPLSYRDHFTASNFRARDLAIEAYESADERIRAEFDKITSAMTSILAAVGAAMREALAQDHIRTARAKGLRERIVVWRHALVNAMLPILTVSGTALGALLGGSVAVERAFGVPGLGLALVFAVAERDWMLIQNLVLLYGTIFVLINLVIDVSYGWFDPRIRYQ